MNLPPSSEFVEEERTSDQVNEINSLIDEAAQQIKEQWPVMVIASRENTGNVANNRDELIEAIVEVAIQKIEIFSGMDLHSEEKLALLGTYGFRGYNGNPRTVADQIEQLAKVFPGLDYTLPPEVIVPEEAEGNFVIPKWNKVGRTYGAALQVIFGSLGKRKKYPLELLDEYLTAEFWNKRGEWVEKTRTSLKLLSDKSSSDIIVVPAQFGLRHLGKSPDGALCEMSDNEFALDPFAISCMLHTHPERMQDCFHPHPICAGMKILPKGPWDEGGMPFWMCNGPHLQLSPFNQREPMKCRGVITGFVC